MIGAREDRRSTPRVLWRRPSGDDGAAGVIVTSLIASGVLLGALALVVDVGRLYAERNDLRNGADIAALALARACAADFGTDQAADCESLDALWDLAQRYADANAWDGASTVERVCGALPGVLPPCGPQPANLTGCIGEPPEAMYVEVHLSTRLPDGSTVLPPSFSQAVTGDDIGTTVGACARAAWGPRAMHILALTLSTCDFAEATESGYGDPENPDWRDERVIQFWFDAHDSCAGPGPEFPWRVPGPAGFLNGGGETCEIGVANDGIVSGAYFVAFEPWSLAPASCENRIRQARADGEVIYLPVHDGVSTGADGFRHVYVAPFLVTGYQFGSPPSADPPYDADEHRDGSYLDGSLYESDPCGTAQIGYRCLTGIFVGEPIVITEITDRTRIRLVG